MIAISGAGISGLTLALGLEKRGIPYFVFDPGKRDAQFGSGTVLTPNATRIYRQLGVLDQLLKQSQRLYCWSFVDRKFQILKRIDFSALENAPGAHHLGIHRARLRDVLLQAIPESRFKWETKIIKTEEQKNQLKVLFHNNETILVDWLVGADGIHSEIRKSIYPHIEPEFAGATVWRGILPKSHWSEPLEDAFEAWVDGARFGVIGVGNEEMMWFAVLPQEQPLLDQRLAKEHWVKSLKRLDKRFLVLVDQTPEEKINQTDVYEIRVSESWRKERILIIGDAALGATPNMGQGVNPAIEDAYGLALAFEKTSNVKMIDRFLEQRKHKTEKLERLSKIMEGVGHVKNPTLAKIRNAVMRLTPDRIAEWGLEQAWDVEDLE